MRRRRKLLFACVVLMLALVLVELLAKAWLLWLAGDESFRSYASISQLRARYGAFDRFQAHRHLGYALAPGYTSGPNRHNSLGFRGEEFSIEKAAGVPRIVCCGGSTTYGESVPDYRQSMPHLLGFGLGLEEIEVEVINAGCPGWTTLETLINFETRLLDLSPDYVLVYHGINDVLPRMVWPHAAFRGDLSGWLARDRHLAEASLLERSDLARVVLVSTGVIEPHGSLLRVIGDVPTTSHTFEFRRQRMAGEYPAGVFREVPIERMLEANDHRYFRRNLTNLIALAEAHGVRVVLATFAYSRDFASRPYIGHPAVQRAIDETNEIVRELARRDGVGLIDVAAELTGAGLFTDGVHFTVAGNIRRGQLAVAWFRDRLP